MSDQSNQTNESGLHTASTESHQAKLMADSHKGKDASSTHDDSPAPMLPPIVSLHHEEEDAPADSKPEFKEPKLEPATNQTTAIQVAPDNDLVPAASETPLFQPQQANSKKAAIGAGATLAVMLGLSAVWYNLNQDVYTLGNQETKVVQETKQQPTPQQPATLGAETKGSTLQLDFKNLPALAQGHYQLWIKEGNETKSLGIFTIQDNQAVTPQKQAFKPTLDNVPAQAELIVTIEAGDNEATTPSSTVILSGTLKDGKADLAFNALDLSQASGSFVIAAPSDLSGDHQSAGIWFAKTDGSNLTGPGLSIPSAPAGWKYEGQVIYKDVAVTIGRFGQANGSDSFFGFTPNPDELPSGFPGEDYLESAPESLGLTFPANLTTGEWKIVISLEPDTNGQDPTGDDTFFLKPLIADIPKDAETYKEYPLTLDTKSFPTATVSIK